MSVSSTFKSIFNVLLVFIALSFLPTLIQKAKDWYAVNVEVREHVGVIEIKGVLYDSNKYQGQLHTFFKDPNIKAILIKMECPGSAAGTGQAIYQEIRALKQQYPKPILTLVENMCASGGYYIASATDWIIAPGSAMVGSIGTAFPYMFQLKEFLDQYKVKTVGLKAGAYKTMTDPLKDMSQPERELLQSVLDDAYDQFAEDIANARKLDPKDRPVWGEGKIFTGRQAEKLKLIDQLGSSSQALAWIKEKAMIEGDIVWVHPAKKEGFLSMLSSGSDDEAGVFELFSDALLDRIEQRYGAASKLMM